MIIVDVFVPGAAKTKGSMEIGNKATGWLRESVVGSKPWRALMAGQVRDDIARRARERCHCGGEDCAPAPWPGPVDVTVVADLLPPLSGQIGRVQPWLWPIWDQAGDLDKLVRNVLDALGSKSKNDKMNGGAIVDDNLVVHIDAWKHVAGEGRPPGVRITVQTIGGG